MTTGSTQRGRTAHPAPGSAGTFRAARLFGFDILVHWSWLIIAALFTWSLATEYLPTVYPDWGAGQRWVSGAVTTVLFFGSVLAHELAHSIVARGRGVPVRDITLFIFGGVSALEGEPRGARDEFWIAIVGPLTSFAAALVFAALWLAAEATGSEPVAAVAGYLAYINVAVGVFNLLPGFPLDGGRVLRSAVWGARGNMLEATRVAANVGRGIAAVLMVLGVLSLVGVGGFGGVWFIFIGWFLWNAAENSYQQLLLQRTLAGLVVGPLAEPPMPHVPPDVTLNGFVRDYILARNQRAFLVGPENGEVLGLMSMSDLGKAPRDAWDDVTVFRAMTPRERLVVVTPDTEVADALRLMAEHNINQLPVVNERAFTGLLTRAALLRAMQFHGQFDTRS